MPTIEGSRRNTPADPAKDHERWLDEEHERWLDEVVYLPEAAALRKVSIDTLRREAKEGRIKILQLSERRSRGITRREALKK
jgi:hypothetical protein